MRRHADQGSADAQCSLAGMLERGQGCTQDVAEARRLYGLAAAQGHTRSQYFLAAMYVDLGGPQDLTEARRLYSLAAASGHVRSDYALAGMLL